MSMDHMDQGRSRGGLRYRREARPPSPGIAAVLSVLLPGLGHVYLGRLLAGALWFLGTGLAYWAILIPGFLVHAACIWFCYRAACDWESY